jgi:hypothetical protein
MAFYSGCHLTLKVPLNYTKADDLVDFLKSGLDGCAISVIEDAAVSKPSVESAEVSEDCQLSGLKSSAEWQSFDWPAPMQNVSGQFQDVSGQFLLRKAAELIKKFLRIQRIHKITRQARAEALINPTKFGFPPKVADAVNALMRERSLDLGELINLAVEHTVDRIEDISEEATRLLGNDESFDWPIEDPLYCVAIAFGRIAAQKAIESHRREFEDGELDPADWWKETDD